MSSDHPYNKKRQEEFDTFIKKEFKSLPPHCHSINYPIKSIWTSVKEKWPEVAQRCVFYDPFSDFIGEGRFTGSGFLLAGHEYKGTHWIDIHKPSKSDIEDTIKWLKSSVG